MNLMPFIGDLGLFQAITRRAAHKAEVRPRAEPPTRPAAAPLADDLSPSGLVRHREKRRVEEAAERLCSPEAVLAFFGRKPSAPAANPVVTAAVPAAASGFSERGRALLIRMGFTAEWIAETEREAAIEAASQAAAQGRR